MAVQKKRCSKTRGRKRRTHYKAKKKDFVFCPQCREPVLFHKVCKSCGYYRGKEAIEIKVKTKKKEKEQAQA